VTVYKHFLDMNPPHFTEAGRTPWCWCLDSGHW
jgi:hypothetical protein